MAKYRFKPTPAGILFLAAIAVLVIALITVVIVLAVNCKSDPSKNKPAVATQAPTDAPSSAPSETPEALETVDPSLNPIVPGDNTPDPNETSDPTSTDNGVVVNTPGANTTAGTTATAAPTYPTSPTSDMKNHSQKGHVTGDQVNMRKGPSKDYNSIKKVAKNTNVTLYKEYSGWWFLKCGSDYGYIKSDYIAKGEAAGTTSGDVSGTVNVSEGKTIALRKGAAKTYECIKEYKKGEAVTIHYKSADGEWYYVTVKSDGKKGWMYASYVKASGKVGTKSN